MGWATQYMQMKTAQAKVAAGFWNTAAKGSLGAALGTRSVVGEHPELTQAEAEELYKNNPTLQNVWGYSSPDKYFGGVGRSLVGGALGAGAGALVSRNPFAPLVGGMLGAVAGHELAAYNNGREQALKDLEVARAAQA